MSNAVTVGQEILNYLSTRGPRRTFDIAYVVGLPEPSVRRWIGTLRNRGFNIQTTRDGYKYIPASA